MDPILIDDFIMGLLPFSRSLSSCTGLSSCSSRRRRMISPTDDQHHIHDQSLHTKPLSSPAEDGISNLHTPISTDISTSAKSALHRLHPHHHQPLHAASDLTKSSSSPLLPRFYLTKNTLLLLSCLLLICNSVPFASAKPQASPLGTHATENARSEPGKETDNFGPRVPKTRLSEFPDAMKCEYYNRTQCEKTGRGCGETFELCHHSDTQGRTQTPHSCYALWKTNTSASNISVELKGCWIGTQNGCDSSHGDSITECIQSHTAKVQRNAVFFCCCQSQMCNANVTPVETSNETSTIPPSTDDNIMDGSVGSAPAPGRMAYYFLMALGFLFLVLVASGVVYMFRNCLKKPDPADSLRTQEPLLDGCHSVGSGYIGLNPVRLKEIRAHGKFGSVWMATDGRDKTVAVKVFQLQDRASWQIEKDVYSLPQMKHNNILNYLGAERSGEGLQVEYWLITEYHSNGSLWDYLKSHTVNLKQLLTIIQGIGRGLTHLHEELPPSATEAAKPSVAHRDFKSKNVLLGNNFRACIADFGLAIVFHQNTLGDCHGQVGTRRYMAPEVLEGAINFNRDSFLRIDMYACGLVLWELLSRCHFGEHVPSEYRLPFEDEVGTHPTLEDMQEIVSQQKKRPQIPEAWLQNPIMAHIAHTVEDCWDQDAEARISASTVVERVQSTILNDNNHDDVSINNHNNTVSYRAPAIVGNNALPNGQMNGVLKNSFLMTAQTQNGHLPTLNGSAAYILHTRETST